MLWLLSAKIIAAIRGVDDSSTINDGNLWGMLGTGNKAEKAERAREEGPETSECLLRAAHTHARAGVLIDAAREPVFRAGVTWSRALKKRTNPLYRALRHDVCSIPRPTYLPSSQQWPETAAHASEGEFPPGETAKPRSTYTKVNRLAG